MAFTLRHKELLGAICNAFIPAVEQNGSQDSTQPEALREFWQRSAGDLKICDMLLELLEAEDEQVKQDFAKALDLFDNRWMLGCTSGYFNSFDKLSLARRERVLQRYSQSPVAELRQLFATLKRIVTFLYYGTSTDHQPNPNWTAIKYPGPLTPPPVIERPIRPLKIVRDVVLECDVLVIGSGAGGGVVAGELAEAGHKVLVVEKGGYFAEDTFNQREFDMMNALYENKGMLTTQDGGMSLFAGSCLGGGTTVNWTGAIATPDYILEEWAQEANLPHLLTDEYKKGFEAIARATHINTDETLHNQQNEILWKGSEKLGHELKLMPRNVRGCSRNSCRECGYCSLGCQHGCKQGSLKTYLQRMYELGGDILVNTEVEKIIIEGGRAKGAKALYRDKSGKAISVEIKAKKVVVAAGAIHTPVLLLRSGLQHPAIGKHLYLHPTMGVSAAYGHQVDPWYGTMMSTINDQFCRLNGNFGFKIETPPLHAGMIASATPWLSGKHHKEMMLRASHLASFIVLTRDRDGGSVKVSPAGKPILDYQISAFDKKHLLRGVEEAIRIHLEAGAEEAYLPHNRMKAYRSGEAATAARDIARLGWQKNAFALFSAHQMGTCRMGGNAATHALSPAGETYEVRNLYVADASTFPRCSGVNPMLSIQAMAYWIAQGLK